MELIISLILIFGILYINYKVLTDLYFTYNVHDSEDAREEILRQIRTTVILSILLIIVITLILTFNN